MHFPRLPDWLIYGAAASALLFTAVGRQERANAPEAPPPVPGEAGMPMSAVLGFDPTRVIRVPGRAQANAGTAFSVSEAGVWLTAAHVVDGCRQAAVVVAPGRGVAARVTLDARRDVAVLTTEGGSPGLPLGPAGAPAAGERGYHPGFPQGGPGEATSVLLGPASLPERRRGQPGLRVLAWTEAGRTEGVDGMLSGLSGAPVLDDAGRVVGLTLGEAPRRGRIYAASPATLRAALQAAGVRPSNFAPGQAINTDNYGRVADALRRDLRVAQVVCLRS